MGIPWLGSTCEKCSYCLSGQENLCDHPLFTGFHKNGGFAEYTTCKADFGVSLPSYPNDMEMAPFLCAGLIGDRSYQKAAPQETLGVYGFGAAAHLLLQRAVHDGKNVYVFTKPGDIERQKFALNLGAIWAGDSTSPSPRFLDAAILFAPDGSLIPKALKILKKGGRCICGGIHMSDIPSFAYEDLWGEKTIASVANLTRDDSKRFFKSLNKFLPHSVITSYPLEKANIALYDLKNNQIPGALVITLS